MKKIFLVFSTIIFVAVVILYFGVILNDKWAKNTNNTNQQQIEAVLVTSPIINEVVSSPLKITGTVNGNGWIGFEGQVGTVELKDDANGNVLGVTYLAATTDWMKMPVSFEANLWYSYSGNGNGTLVFHNENPSGEPSRDKKFTIPVKLTTASADKTTFNVYFTNSQIDAPSCEDVVPSKRDVPKTQSVAKAALEELLKGPTPVEKNAGYTTNINEGVKLNSVTMENGVAKADFGEELNKNVAGSCKVMAIRSQIEKTLKQFPTVKSVVISINGKTEGILQP